MLQSRREDSKGIEENVPRESKVFDQRLPGTIESSTVAAIKTTSGRSIENLQINVVSPRRSDQNVRQTQSTTDGIFPEP